MEDFTMFEEVACEEYYSDFVESAEYRAWLEEMEIDFVNAELQEAADELREVEVL